MRSSDANAPILTDEALRTSEARLAEAQRIAQMGNWVWHIDSNDLHWSDETYRIFGLAPQQFGATYEAFLGSVHPDDREFVEQAVYDALHRNKPYRIDHRVVRPDGSELTGLTPLVQPSVVGLQGTLSPPAGQHAGADGEHL